MDEPTQERVARNDATFRGANEAIRAAAETYQADFAVPYVCECADPVCRVLIRLTVVQYEEVRADSRHFLTAPGHAQSGEEGNAVVVARRDGYEIVEKMGRAGEIAESLDERAAGAGKDRLAGADE